jgi:hypothetical protein
VVVVDMEKQEHAPQPSIQILGVNLEVKHQDRDLYGSLAVRFLIPRAYIERFINEYETLLFKTIPPQIMAVYAQSNVPVTRSKWSLSEVEFLRQNYPKFGAKLCAQVLGRTIKSVERKAATLGLRVGSDISQVSQTSPSQVLLSGPGTEALKVQLPPEAKKFSPAAQELLAYLHSIAGPDGEVILRIDQFTKGRNIGVAQCSKARDELIRARFLVPLPSPRSSPQKYKLTTPKKGILQRLFAKKLYKP